MDATAKRVSVHEARRHFAEGGEVLVSDRGHLEELPVSSLTTTHTNDRTSWEELAGLVSMWRNRYPNQRYYVVERA